MMKAIPNDYINLFNTSGLDEWDFSAGSWVALSHKFLRLAKLAPCGSPARTAFFSAEPLTAPVSHMFFLLETPWLCFTTEVSCKYWMKVSYAEWLSCQWFNPIYARLWPTSYCTSQYQSWDERMVFKIPPVLLTVSRIGLIAHQLAHFEIRNEYLNSGLFMNNWTCKYSTNVWRWHIIKSHDTFWWAFSSVSASCKLYPHGLGRFEFAMSYSPHFSSHPSHLQWLYQTPTYWAG